MIEFEDFLKVDLRSGTVVKVEPFERSRNPSYKIWVDFGSEIGTRQTSAQVTAHYTPETLRGKQVIGCINLLPKNIAGFTSEFLLVGFEDEGGRVVLAMPSLQVPNGQKLF